MRFRGFGTRLSRRDDYRLFAAFFVLAWVALLSFMQPTYAADDFLDPEKAFVFSAAIAEPSELHLHYEIAPKYYMYRGRFEFDGFPNDAQTPIFPQGTVVYDPTFDEDMEVFHEGVTVVVPLAAPASDGSYQLDITSQGCAEAGLCYPPRTDTLQLAAVDGQYQLSGDAVRNSVPAPINASQLVALQSSASGSIAASSNQGAASSVLQMGDSGLAHWLSQASWVQILGLSFLFGVLLTLTPCVLPMVPIVLAVVVGDAASSSTPASRWRGFSLAAVYVLGMSLVYTLLGVIAGHLGASLSVWLQTPWVLAAFALVLALLALAMFGVFRLQTPSGMQGRLNTLINRLPGGHVGGAFLMGMVSALIVGPCIAAPLAGVLLFISQTGDYFLGGSALFAMAWGQGLLLLIVGAGSRALLPKAGPWMEAINHFFGLLLLATAWWMVSPILPAAVLMLGWALLAMWAALLFGAFSTLPAELGQALRLTRMVLRAIGLLLAAWAVILLIGLAAGGRDSLQPLATLGSSETAQKVVPSPTFTLVNDNQELDALLASTSKPVLLDFYADWCVSCLEMERFTFSDATVANLMGQFTLVQADVTKNTEAHRELLKRFQLFGPPGILFFDRDGVLMPEPRVIGFQNASQFGQTLQRVLVQ